MIRLRYTPYVSVMPAMRRPRTDAEEFELKPDKPGFANRCPACSSPEPTVPTAKRQVDADERKAASEVSEARRQAMRELLYRKDS
jgi:hypothetical protein